MSSYKLSSLLTLLLIACPNVEARKRHVVQSAHNLTTAAKVAGYVIAALVVNGAFNSHNGFICHASDGITKLAVAGIASYATGDIFNISPLRKIGKSLFISAGAIGIADAERTRNIINTVVNWLPHQCRDLHYCASPEKVPTCMRAFALYVPVESLIEYIRDSINQTSTRRYSYDEDED